MTGSTAFVRFPQPETMCAQNGTEIELPEEVDDVIDEEEELCALVQHENWLDDSPELEELASSG